MTLPEQLESVEVLEDWLSRPVPAAIEALAESRGDVIVLGAGGKIGPTLTRMIKRAAPERRVIAVSRFSDDSLPEQLRGHGIEVIVGDLLDEGFVATLPDCPNVIYLAGMKFGASEDLPLTWAMNTYLPTIVCKRFRESRIVALSSGNVYGLSSVYDYGSHESDTLQPVGEYANSCLGRERMFEYFSKLHDIPTAIIRLNYANELRYGVLLDLAKQVLAGDAIDISMGYVNVIWQGDANAMIVAAMTQVTCPPKPINVAGMGRLKIIDLCQEIAAIAGVEPCFRGREACDALLSDARGAWMDFGEPTIDLSTLLRWVVLWVQSGGPTLGKPTKFENRHGSF
jgi:nucleoside-diphosphate-sugar epimerase